MQMFVWNNLWSISDAGPGTVCVVASSLEEAINIVEEEAKEELWSKTYKRLIEEIGYTKPKIKKFELTWGSM